MLQILLIMNWYLNFSTPATKRNTWTSPDNIPATKIFFGLQIVCQVQKLQYLIVFLHKTKYPPSSPQPHQNNALVIVGSAPQWQWLSDMCFGILKHNSSWQMQYFVRMEGRYFLFRILSINFCVYRNKNISLCGKRRICWNSSIRFCAGCNTLSFSSIIINIEKMKYK